MCAPGNSYCLQSMTRWSTICRCPETSQPCTVKGYGDIAVTHHGSKDKGFGICESTEEIELQGTAVIGNWLVLKEEVDKYFGNDDWRIAKVYKG